MTCSTCDKEQLAARFGENIECVNGVLIDIDEAMAGWDNRANYSVAPCHPMWEQQTSTNTDLAHDVQTRLEQWSKSRLAPEDCLFCGSSSVITMPNDRAETGVELGRSDQDAFYCHCEGCGADGPVGDNHFEAISLWNLPRNLKRSLT